MGQDVNIRVCESSSKVQTGGKKLESSGDGVRQPSATVVRGAGVFLEAKMTLWAELC